MQSLEAILSFIMLIMLSLPLLSVEQPAIDDSLYRTQLAHDVWRVLYLRGDFEDFSFDKGNPARDRAEADMKEITELTNICIFISGERLTSCRGEETGKHIVTVKKLLVVNGAVEKVSVTLAHRLPP